MQDNKEEVTLGSLLEVPDTQWPSITTDSTHQWPAYALYPHPNMLKIHDNSHKLCSKKHDSQALIAIEVKGKWGDDFMPIMRVRLSRTPASASSPICPEQNCINKIT